MQQTVYSECDKARVDIVKTKTVCLWPGVNKQLGIDTITNFDYQTPFIGALQFIFFLFDTSMASLWCWPRYMALFR